MTIHAKQRRFSIHTSGLNSSVYVHMLYFANLVNQYAKDFTLVTLPSGGGPSNMISVNDGEASFGTTTAESLKAAYEGTSDFSGRPQRRIRHVASFGFSLMFIYTDPESSVQSISDLSGKKVVFGGGTGSALLGREILDVYGIANRVISVRGPTDKAREALAKREIDAIFTVAKIPVPTYSEMVKKNALKFLAVDPDKIKALQQRSPFYVKVELKDYYSIYPTPVNALGLPGPVVTREDMDPDVVYEMLQIVYSHVDELQRMSEGFKGETPETGLNGLAIPLHEGAEKFFKEAGLVF
ncbi:MAG: TAXI family TRAP transporter solute-binding subunit [Candidatus Binatia bacterium]